MKKLIPFLVSGILLVGTIGCQEATKTGSETNGTTNEAAQAPAKEASQKTETAAKTATDNTKTAATGAAKKIETGAKTATDKAKTAATGAATDNTKSSVKSKLAEKIPGSKLEAEDKDGVVTIKGTVPSEADLKKIEPAVKEINGVKSVKVEAKVAAAKAQ